MNFKTVIIGANDGFGGPCSIEYPALMVEPIPVIFKKLKESFPKAICENVAIYTENKEIDFYVCRRNTTISGLEIKTPMQNRKRRFFYTIKVPTMTLDHLFNKHSIEDIETFMVDVEGFDLMVLLQLFNMKIRPKIIYYEHKHMSIDETKQILSIFYKENYDARVISSQNSIAKLKIKDII